MKGSKTISARAKATGAARSGSTRRNPPSPATDGFALGGPSDPPDPSTNAYRKDLADVSLAGRVIASHYAEPLVRHLIKAATLHAAADGDAQPVSALKAGDELRVLDISLGWAWGYAPDGRVGYVPAEAVGV